MDQVRLGVIGCGSMARNHMNCFPHIKGLRFVAAADPVGEAREAVAEAHDVKTFADGHELIASGLVDAVLIATPHYYHPTYTIAAFEHGLHVLTEKPLAVTAKAAQEMIDAADKRPDLVFAAMFQMRAAPLWQEVKRLIDAGEVGTLMRASWTITTWYRTQAYYNSGGWRATWKGEGGGVLLNQCPHNLDIFTWLVGQPEQVQAIVGLGQYHDIEVEDEVTAILRFPNGATGTFITSTAQTPGINRLEIVGDQGTLIINPGDNPPITLLRNQRPALDDIRHSPERFASPPHTRHAVTPGGQDPGHAGIHQNFVDAILHGAPLLAPAREGIRGLELGNAILMSGLQQRPVNLPTDRDAFDALLQDLINASQQQKPTARQPAGAS